MKCTGIIRKVDNLGRIVLPKELRTILDIDERDPLEIFVDEQFIMLQKYAPNCIFCGSTGDNVRVCGKNVCPTCAKEIRQAVS